MRVETAADLRFYLAYGVTTVRKHERRPQHLCWRDEIAARQRVGPRMVTAGPCMGEVPCACDGFSAEEFAGAWPHNGPRLRLRQGLRSLVCRGYAAIAGGTHSTAWTWSAMCRTPRLTQVISSDQRSVEHLDGYSNLQPDDRPALIAADGRPRRLEHAHVGHLAALPAVRRCAVRARNTAMRRYTPWRQERTLHPADFATRAYVLGPVSAQRRGARGCPSCRVRPCSLAPARRICAPSPATRCARVAESREHRA
ncbi:MAG: hypothetical protein R2854_06610 [Caldilineaceae bacterium]